MVMLLYGKKRHIRYLLATVRPPIFAPHFFTIEDVSLLEKSRDENKVIFIGTEDLLYFENYIKNQ